MPSEPGHRLESPAALRASEERFRLFVVSVRDYAIFMLDPQGHVSTWNPGAERIKGYAASDIVGQHFSRFYLEADVAAGKPAHELAVAAAQGRFEDEGWRVRKDGSLFWANVVITALRDETGRLVGFAKVTRDLTERRRAEQARIRLAEEQAARSEAEAVHRRTALLAEASRLLAALDNESVLAAVVRLAVPVADLCIVQLLENVPGEAGETTLRTAAVHGASGLGRAPRAPAPVPFDPRGPHPVAVAIRSGRVQRLADLGAVPDAELRAALDATAVRALLVAPLVARGRHFGAVLLGFADPSADRPGAADLLLADQLAGRVAIALDNARLFEQAQAAARARQHALAARDVFLARASHELRTPLTSALGTIRLLKRALTGDLKQSPEELVDMSLRSLDVMAALVNDLLDASALQAGGVPLAREPVAVGRLVRESLELVAAHAREKVVRLGADVRTEATLSADRLRLEQLLVNLLANGIKFTPPGGEVRLEADRHGDDGVRLRVIDTGEGIAEEYLTRIFEPFYQVGRTSARRSRGTGLGLSICRQIATLHGGRIWAESAGLGHGACFVVELPLVAAEPPAG